jgi:sugar phosphate isomerase/epimerase
MARFGFKVVDRSRDDLGPVLAAALAQGRPVEVGLYCGDEGALGLLRERLPGSGCPVAVHLDHRVLSLFELEGRGERLARQLDEAVRLGARYVVTHCSAHPMTPRPERRAEVVARLAEGARSALSACESLGLGLHLENTYHDLDFYRALVGGLAGEGLSRLGWCFDLGHARVWSTRDLGDWLDFLGGLAGAGRRLHCHLHANDGLADRHLSFAAAEREGLSGPDPFVGPLGVFDAIARLDLAFPEAIKVLEVPPGEAVADLALVETRLAELRASAGRSGESLDTGAGPHCPLPRPYSE